MAISLYTQSLGSSKANLTVQIRNATTQVPAVIYNSGSMIVNTQGLVALDSSGNLSTYIDTAFTWTVSVISDVKPENDEAVQLSPAQKAAGAISLYGVTVDGTMVAPDGSTTFGKSVQSLVSGAGNTGNAIVDALVDAANRRSYTFAEALALAPSNVGKSFWIPSVGDGGSWWYADSSGYLRPVGGKCHLVSKTGSVGSPLLQYTGFTNYVFALPVKPVIPAGMLIPGQSHIWFHAWCKRAGANGTAVLKLHIGLNDNVGSDLAIEQITSAAIDNLDDTLMPMVTVPLSTRLSTTWTKQLYGTTGGAVGADNVTGVNTAVPMYGNISIASANVADTFKLIAYRLTVEQ